MIQNKYDALYIPDGKRGPDGRWRRVAAAMTRQSFAPVATYIEARCLANAVKRRFGSGGFRRQADGTYIVAVTPP